MKKVKSIHAGLIAAVLLASVSTSAIGGSYTAQDRADEAYRLRADAEYKERHLAHWYPWTGPMEYFWNCTLGGQCTGSKWR